MVLNELVHEGIMGTSPDNKRGRGRLDIVHLAPIIHCCEKMRIPTYLPLLCFPVGAY